MQRQTMTRPNDGQPEASETDRLRVQIGELFDAMHERADKQDERLETIIMLLKDIKARTPRP